MSQYDAHSSNVFSAGLKRFAELQIKPKLLTMCKEVAQQLVLSIDDYFGEFNPPAVPAAGTTQFPVWFGQLHDATGVGVYCDGALSSFLPTKKALDSQPQSHNGITGIIGSEWLQEALSNASSEFATGIWIVLFSSVPYAYKINTQGSPRGRGVGFFEALKQTLLNDVLVGLQPVAL